MTGLALSAFLADLSRFGIVYNGPVQADDKLHRFKAEGDHDANSWFALRVREGVVFGGFGCWKRGVKQGWCSKKELTQAEQVLQREALRDFAERDKQEREEKQAKARTAVAAGFRTWKKATEHAYLSNKKLAPVGDVRVCDLESYRGWLVVPMFDAKGVLQSAQYIAPDGSKRFQYGGQVQGCMFPVRQEQHGPILVCEGYATGLSLAQSTGWTTVCAFNCGNLLAVARIIRKAYPDRLLIVAGDNDAGTQDNPGLTKATEAAADVKGLCVVPTFADSAEGRLTDFNDLACISGAAEVKRQVMSVLPANKVPWSVRSPAEILEMHLPDNDCILGDRLLAKGQYMTLLGAGGIGKSRILLQLAVSCILGRSFLGIETRNADLTWLILQGENTVRRLKFDLLKLKAWSGDGWPKVCAQLQIHTLETDGDFMLSLGNPDNVRRADEIISRLQPDVVAWDNLKDFSSGDLNSDEVMSEACHSIASVSKRGNPDRAVVLLHHALTGKGGAVKATGFERAGFGRNSKILQSWTRGQINIAPVDAANNDRLVVGCGKCSNGREFEPFAVHLDPATMIYAVEEGFDVAEWETDVNKAKGGRARKSPLQKVLGALKDHGVDDPITTSRWAEKAGVHRSTLNGYLDELRVKGWMNTAGEGNSARKYITEDGLAALESGNV